MDPEALESSLDLYKSQFLQINETLKITAPGDEYDSLTSLKSDIQQLVDLTTESLETLKEKQSNFPETNGFNSQNGCSSGEDSIKDVRTKDKEAIDDEYALFMSEMTKSGAYDDKAGDDEVTPEDGDSQPNETNPDTNIEEELSSLEGMKCSTMYCHKWGGAPSLHNAMVCSVVRDEDDNTNFYDIKVRVMFTNPTHVEMVPCPYYLDGDCKFSDDQCRYSHGEVVHLSSLSEAVEPNFSLLKSGCRVLAKLSQEDEAMSSKALEKYLLWHRAVVKSVDSAAHRCDVHLEHEGSAKGNSSSYHTVDFSQVFPLTDNTEDSDTDTESSLSETPTYDDAIPGPSKPLPSSSLVDFSLQQDPGSVKLGDWEKHTKGIGSKIMEQMGYVTGTGLGPSGTGRLQPVPCRPSLPGRSLDHCMTIREHSETEDPIKVEKKLRRLQRKQEEREKKAYERAKEKERHNVFNVLNDVFSNPSVNGHQENESSPFPSKKNKADKLSDVKSSTCKNLNIEQFNISEDIKRLDKDISKLKGSLSRNAQGSSLHKSLSLQLAIKSRELDDLKARQKSVSNEQSVRKDKKKMTVF